MNDTFTFRRYRDGDSTHVPWPQDVVVAGESAQCPVYLHRTPPCQGGCPAGEDIRGWLGIVRGLELPPAGTSPQAYAFQRATDANPFPAIMGRVCPAPCEDGCNRNHLDDRVGINAVEQFIGDWALGQRARLERPAPETGRHVAIVGGGVAGLACAYQLRRKGHACTIFDERTELGGMARYGIPGYRIPRAVMDGEFERILDTGVEARMGIRVGRDIPIETIEREFDAVLLAIGAQSGQRLPYPGGDAPNCVSGIAFLQAFNEGRLKIAAHRVVVIGGGDTAIDVVSVARRLGHVRSVSPKDRPENVLLGHTAHDVATAARREGAEVRLVYRRPIEKMRAARHEVEAALREGVEIQGSLAPVEVVLGADGRARALRVVPVEWTDEGMVVQEGAEFDIPCDLVVAAIGQAGDFTGIEAFDNGKGQVDADAHFQVPDRPGYFVAGDAVRPHLLTTAVGQAAVAAESIDHYLKHEQLVKRPKVDVHHFDLLSKLREAKGSPAPSTHEPVDESREADSAVHNYEDRAASEIIPVDDLFLAYFEPTPRHRRTEVPVSPEGVLGHFHERTQGLEEAEAVAEAQRCMSCGMCLECDNCVIYCPQEAVRRTPKAQATTGRYVYTDYNRCIGCHICADVCPSGYLAMGMGVAG